GPHGSYKPLKLMPAIGELLLFGAQQPGLTSGPQEQVAQLVPGFHACPQLCKRKLLFGRQLSVPNLVFDTYEDLFKKFLDLLEGGFRAERLDCCFRFHHIVPPLLFNFRARPRRPLDNAPNAYSPRPRNRTAGDTTDTRRHGIQPAALSSAICSAADFGGN